ncbi:diguanylate cyclase [Roseateles sp.]|uniref:diguanylate cyclase domain-containing protein n=1 Tax=Roseateles sp. TaxID=1971397 RepID=UPI0025F239F8|nr:diguanylate cyclase [Roseateles sp.]MBV8033501.1 diguanylate cyclase [Roseateles sp.]
MSVTQLVLQDTAPTGRGGYAPTRPMVQSLVELVPYLSRRLARCRRDGEQMALLWIELAPVPSPVADAAGTTAELLRTAGLRVRNRVRGTDEVVQVGEQGFAVLLPGAGGAEAALVALRLKQTLSGAYGLDSGQAHLAVAMGEAAYPETGLTGTELAEAAQRSLALRQEA